MRYGELNTAIKRGKDAGDTLHPVLRTSEAQGGLSLLRRPPTKSYGAAVANAGTDSGLLPGTATPKNQIYGPVSPSWGRTVTVTFNGAPTELTVARHNYLGVNRFGQHAREFPFCCINRAAWTDCEFDLTLVRWFRTAAEAASVKPVDDVPQRAMTAATERATFPGSLVVEVRCEGSRWHIYVKSAGRWTRCQNSLTFFAEHARRTAEHWFGQPIDWLELNHKQRGIEMKNES